MKVVSNHDPIFAHSRRVFDTAVKRSVARARQNLKPGLGAPAGSMRASIESTQIGPLKARIGSDHPGARAQELGAYITPKKRKALKYTHNGRVVFNRAAVRLRGKKYLQRAKDSWRTDKQRAIKEIGQL